jgi:hypothetical protein
MMLDYRDAGGCGYLDVSNVHFKSFVKCFDLQFRGCLPIPPTRQNDASTCRGTGRREPAHVVRFGTQVHVKSILSGTKEADRHIGYLAKHLSKGVRRAAGLDEHPTVTMPTGCRPNSA